jgi:hypothetical protein
MDDMREIITLDEANRLFLILAVAVPVVCVALGALAGARRGALGRGAMNGLLIGLLGPANLALWKIYNLITDRLGLDTVKNLLINLGLFIALGIIAGIVIGHFASRRASTLALDTPDSADEAPQSG